MSKTTPANKKSGKHLNRKLIAKDLHDLMIDFKNKVNECDSQMPIPNQLNAVLVDHFSAVMGIIRQHVINDQFSDSSKPVGGQRNELAREFFRQEVENRLIKKLKPFPSWDTFSKTLDATNAGRINQGLPEIEISSRAFDNYIDEWKKGVFDFP
ncbi:hypothetical protein [Polynucleobacter yangtzensis]|uniref:hypothetical protein n=1 Tax=Polynucleobacter yangtzensis TaxID=1743159 RepID=UPI0008323B87|nr:hypothetical protein [Polynucleobacter yangtzensis]